MPLILTGGITSAVFHATRNEVKQLYRTAEMRRMTAKDI